MIDFEQAVAIVRDHIAVLDSTVESLDEAVGLVLAEDVRSDVDMPPFDKSAMDGFAVRAADVAQAPVRLRIVEEIPAGRVPTRPIGPGECSRIMTGAPLPAGADTVVRDEDTGEEADGQVTIVRPAARGQNICFKSEDVRSGQVVLTAGHRLRAPEVALLAACGYSRVRVTRRPRCAVLSTGDEVVPVDSVPRPGQIRDANSHYVRSRLRQAVGIVADALGIAPDDPAVMRDRLSRGLEYDVLLTSGAVSAGRYDRLPAVMREMGIAFFFEQVRMQPGRPMIFGRRGATTVFGLPGNPVAVMVAMEMFVLPALRQMMGYSATERGPTFVEAELEGAIRHRPGRRSHKPAVLRWEGGTWRVRPVEYHGSAHVAALSQANALIVQPSDVAVQESGSRVEVARLEG